jgi:hypothetical protein
MNCLLPPSHPAWTGDQERAGPEPSILGRHMDMLSGERSHESTWIDAACRKIYIQGHSRASWNPNIDPAKRRLKAWRRDKQGGQMCLILTWWKGSSQGPRAYWLVGHHTAPPSGFLWGLMVGLGRRVNKPGSFWKG